MKNMSETG